MIAFKHSAGDSERPTSRRQTSEGAAVQYHCTTLEANASEARFWSYQIVVHVEEDHGAVLELRADDPLCRQTQPSR